MKGDDGVPIPDMQERTTSIDESEIKVQNYEGLKIAFTLSAQGKSDREVAMALNELGYRTTGTHGPSPFSKDTVKDMLKNKFYIGYISDGNGGWLEAQHDAFITEELWNQVQESRERNRKAPRNRPASATISSLAGITFCWYCKGRIHVGTTKSGKRRMLCYNRAKGWSCPQKSTLLEVYEYQVEKYLETFHISEDYQAKILEAHSKLQAAYSDIETERAAMEARLERIKKLYSWGDMSEKDYLTEKDSIVRKLQTLTPYREQSLVLEQLANFLKSVVVAWKEATQDQRNRLARQLFDEIWVKDKQVIAVKPRPELEPFFKLSYEDWLSKFESESPKPSGVANSNLWCHSLFLLQHMHPY